MNKSRLIIKKQFVMCFFSNFSSVNITAPAALCHSDGGPTGRRGASSGRA
jgi:hypothetical protein